jgi:RND family efflux transporter MFP subunit
MTSRKRSIIAAALALATAGCGGRKTAVRAEEPAMLLGVADVAVVESTELASGIPVSGTLKPAVDVHISAPAPEVLEAVLVREGQPVFKGQVLARFRSAALAADAASAEAQARVAAADLARMKNLLAAGAVSERDVEGADAQASAAEAARAASAKRLEDATVRAPVRGTIAKRWVQGGDRVSEGDPLFRLVNNADLEFEATVPSQHAPRVRAGTPVRLTVSGAGATIQGRIARVNPTADAATRQVKVYATVPNPDGHLVGDLFAAGTVLLERSGQALAVPRGAIHQSGDTTWVWRITGGRLERRAVVTGVADEARDLIETTGLTRGDSVVVSPTEEQTPGRRVQITAAGAAPVAARASGK